MLEKLQDNIYTSVLPHDSLTSSGASFMINKIDKVMSYGCNVELNTGFVEQIDGAGVGALACLYKKLVSRGRNLSIVDMHPEPFSMMQNLGLDAILNIKQKINEEKTI